MDEDLGTPKKLAAGGQSVGLAESADCEMPSKLPASGQPDNLDDASAVECPQTQQAGGQSVSLAETGDLEAPRKRLRKLADCDQPVSQVVADPETPRKLGGSCQPDNVDDSSVVECPQTPKP